jgi:NADPH-dependent curcumin reductase
MSLLVNRASMTGFMVMDYVGRYGEAGQEIAGWLARGELKAQEDIVTGLDTFPETLLRLFSGEHNGKLILRVAQD